jgi:peptidoglycan/xylan/chitin deacetylase (PgdA/CDA1 family)
MVTWNQLAEISESGIECAAHSHTHPPLTMLPPSVARDEIVRSKELLEDHLSQEVSSFAYPFGYYSARIQQIVKATGYTSACAIKRVLSSLYDNPYALARLAIWPDTSKHDLAAALSADCGPLIASSLQQARTYVRQNIHTVYGRLWSSRNIVSQSSSVSSEIHAADNS